MRSTANPSTTATVDQLLDRVLDEYQGGRNTVTGHRVCGSTLPPPSIPPVRGARCPTAPSPGQSSREAAAEIADLKPDAVVILASRDVRVGLTEQTPPGFVQQRRRLDELGIPVPAMRDNPRFDYSIPDCVHRRDSPHDTDQTEAVICGAPRDAVYGPQPPWALLPDIPLNVAFLDIADAVCEPAFCAAEIGDVLVYLDDNHLSASYATSMADLLEDDVTSALG